MKANGDGTLQRLDEVLALVQSRMTAAQRGSIERFVARYFGQVDPEDLDERAPADLYGAALSHWNFARRREPGRARVRVFNPTIEEHGWQSTHTIIEIVNDDMPFLVDSVTMEVNRHGLTLHLIVHPILRGAARDGRHADENRRGDAPDVPRESFIHVEVDRLVEPARLDALAADVARVLSDVRMAVADWKKMQDRILDIVAELERHPAPLPADELAEDKAFLSWLADGPFHVPRLPLSRPRRRRRTGRAQDRPRLEPRHPARRPQQERRDELRAAAAGGPCLRAGAGPPDRHQGERALDGAPPGLPRLRRASSASTATARCAASTASSASTRRWRTAPTWPTFRSCGARRRTSSRGRASPAAATRARRSSTSSRSIRATSCSRRARTTCCARRLGILHLGERQRFRLFVRRDAFERFLTCLIYSPRENYTTELREKWQAILQEAFNGTSSEFNVHFSESVLARIMITVRTTPGRIPAFDVRELEARLAAAARRWDDDLRDALIDACGEARGNELVQRFGGALPAGYRDEFARARRGARHRADGAALRAEPARR